MFPDSEPWRAQLNKLIGRWKLGIIAEHDEAQTRMEEALSNYTPRDLNKYGFGVFSLRLEHIEERFGSRKCFICTAAKNGGPIALDTDVTQGDVVEVFLGGLRWEHKGEMLRHSPLCEGIVLNITSSLVRLVVDSDISLGENEDIWDKVGARVTLLPAYRNRANKQMADFMFRIEKWPYAIEGTLPSPRVLQTCFGTLSEYVAEELGGKIPHVDVFEINESQAAAATTALTCSDPIHLIIGPPGTGKTTTLVRVVEAAVASGHRVLVCAPSNVAVDNIADACLVRKMDPSIMLRLGHPARLDPGVLSISYYEKISKTSATIRKMQRELKKEKQKLAKIDKKKVTRQNFDEIKAERQESRAAVRCLEKCMRMSQRDEESDLIKSASVILSTLMGTTASFFMSNIKERFDLVIIDEAAQATEPATWAAARLGERLVLAGDPFQLPPTVMSDEAKKQGLSVSLMERMLSRVKSGCRSDMFSLLEVQYRMNSVIMGWSNRVFYEGRLRADPTVAERTLDHPYGDCPLLLLDTSGQESTEETVADVSALNKSKMNPGEAQVVMNLVLDMREGGLDLSVDGLKIITPYKAQVALIRESLRGEGIQDVFVGTADSCQGSEADVVIISMVRSNHEGNLGFIKDLRRMNVAVTRAKTLCAIVCDSATVSTLAELGELVAEAGSKGLHVAADDVMKKVIEWMNGGDTNDLELAEICDAAGRRRAVHQLVERLNIKLSIDVKHESRDTSRGRLLVLSRPGGTES